ncbi:hypothetical protein [Bacillus sp. REN10]|uniref:hypothetical protein n=1 Tax=Bacillus sp. REN10 TaxID=2782541 RepID=UPI00193B0721|nr:hypothetical protein [Bacillus sp. REN10]
MSMSLKDAFNAAKRISPSLKDKSALDMAYIGLTHVVAHNGTHDDLVSLANQYETLVNVHVLKKGVS